jgi:hypothetical protein
MFTHTRTRAHSNTNTHTDTHTHTRRSLGGVSWPYRAIVSCRACGYIYAPMKLTLSTVKLSHFMSVLLQALVHLLPLLLWEMLWSFREVVCHQVLMGNRFVSSVRWNVGWRCISNVTPQLFLFPTGTLLFSSGLWWVRAILNELKWVQMNSDEP